MLGEGNSKAARQYTGNRQRVYAVVLCLPYSVVRVFMSVILCTWLCVLFRVVTPVAWRKGKRQEMLVL